MCKKSCDAGFYADSKDQSCALCSGNCQTCSKTFTNCTSCDNNRFLSNNSTCVRDCGPGFFSDNATRSCKPCNKNCADCFGNFDNCTICTSGKFRSVDGKCVDSCAKDEFIRSIARLSPLCVKDCGKAFFVLPSNRSCLPCNVTCATCTGHAQRCSSCPSGKFLNKTQCVSRCSDGYYGNTKEGKCKPCGPTCKTCFDGTADSVCSACVQGRYLSKFSYIHPLDISDGVGGGGDGLGRTAFDEQIVKALTFEINLIMFVTHIFEKKIICENGYKKKHLLKFQDCRIT